MACRDINLGIEVKKIILSKVHKYNGQIFVKQLDLNSFDSIIKFSDGIRHEFDEIYALVNNAGIFYYPQELTKEGFDVTFQTNYLGN